MNLSFTSEQEAYRKKVREWLIENLPEGWGTPQFKWPDDENEVSQFYRNWMRKVYEAGFGGISWPKEYGGQGLTFVEEIIFDEEAGKLNAPATYQTQVSTLLLGPTLLQFGTEEQKKRFISPLLKGEEVWCQGFSEPNAGSDLASMQTKAELDGDEWVINGQKVWTSVAHLADWCFVLARTDSHAPKHKGISFFLVPMDSPGLTIRPIVQINKNRDFCEVFFENVRIPKDNIVGNVNEGWKVTMGTLAYERGLFTLGRQARFQNEFIKLAKLAGQGRTSDGEDVRTNSHYRQRLSEVYNELQIMRYHGLKTISQLLNDGKLGPEVSLQKLYYSTLHSKMGELAMDVLGEEAPYWGQNSIGLGEMQNIFIGSRAETIYAGTSQIQKNIIAEKVLGMPR
jgi:alkylation response protein AidB-like acyl-CoA dehydrogenase